MGLGFLGYEFGGDCGRWCVYGGRTGEKQVPRLARNDNSFQELSKKGKGKGKGNNNGNGSGNNKGNGKGNDNNNGNNNSNSQYRGPSLRSG